MYGNVVTHICPWSTYSGWDRPIFPAWKYGLHSSANYAYVGYCAFFQFQICTTLSNFHLEWEICIALVNSAFTKPFCTYLIFLELFVVPMLHVLSCFLASKCYIAGATMFFLKSLDHFLWDVCAICCHPSCLIFRERGKSRVAHLPLCWFIVVDLYCMHSWWSRTRLWYVHNICCRFSFGVENYTQLTCCCVSAHFYRPSWFARRLASGQCTLKGFNRLRETFFITQTSLSQHNFARLPSLSIS